ncbi:hypothetical protein AB1Y20_019504 [Prymnesium parvum]|uniref:Uncharacterized protein n=1 Tax=Prymnesium parvum TaxID=97485 RepID=A0AB34JSQ6_PRYPA
MPPKPPRWRPPSSVEERLKATGEASAQLLRCWECIPPLPPPRAGEWLAAAQPGARDRRGQSFADFSRPGPHRTFPSRQQQKIYLTPLGAADAAPAWAALAGALAACFSLPVCALPSRLPREELAALARDACGAGYGEQLEAPSVHALLARHRPRDAFALVAYAADDLCDSSKGFSFLFGQANLDKGTAVVSFARYQDAMPSLTLRRCALVLCHEVGHLFGIKHCIWGRCIMNGSNHLEEADSRGFALCPVELCKLASSLAAVQPLDATAREEAMLRWLGAHGLHADAEESRQRLRLMRGETEAATEVATPPPFVLPDERYDRRTCGMERRLLARLRAATSEGAESVRALLEPTLASLPDNTRIMVAPPLGKPTAVLGSFIDPSVIVWLLLDPLDVDSKQVTYCRLEAPEAIQLFEALYKWAPFLT